MPRRPWLRLGDALPSQRANGSPDLRGIWEVRAPSVHNPKFQRKVLTSLEQCQQLADPCSSVRFGDLGLRMPVSSYKPSLCIPRLEVLGRVWQQRCSSNKSCPACLMSKTLKHSRAAHGCTGPPSSGDDDLPRFCMSGTCVLKSWERLQSQWPLQKLLSFLAI